MRELLGIPNLITSVVAELPLGFGFVIPFEPLVTMSVFKGRQLVPLDLAKGIANFLGAEEAAEEFPLTSADDPVVVTLGCFEKSVELK
jgi:hypothetical protein